MQAKDRTSWGVTLSAISVRKAETGTRLSLFFVLAPCKQQLPSVLLLAHPVGSINLGEAILTRPPTLLGARSLQRYELPCTCREPLAAANNAQREGTEQHVFQETKAKALLHTNQI